MDTLSDYVCSMAKNSERAHVLAIATEYRQEALILQRCAQLLGYRLQFCGIGEPWGGWGTKLVQYRHALETNLRLGEIAQTDPVLLIDGWDCILVGPATEFQKKMASPPYSTCSTPWYAGERICGPDFFKASRIDQLYEDPGTPWRYPNAGCMCGRAMSVLQLLEELLAGHDQATFPKDYDDQGRLHEYLLELGERGQPLPFMVDSHCAIFQCLYEAEPQWVVEGRHKPLPRLRNVLTGEIPVVLHGNGHTGRWFMQGLWREMQVLRHIRLTHEEIKHLPYDGPVAPGTIPDVDTVRSWSVTFQLYAIIEKQMAYARLGIEWDPWKDAAVAKEAQTLAGVANSYRRLKENKIMLSWQS